VASRAGCACAKRGQLTNDLGEVDGVEGVQEVWGAGLLRERTR
jgi:hypothetical protein